MESYFGEQPAEPSKPSKPVAVLSFLLAGALVAGIILLALALLPGSVPKQTNPHWLDLIVDNRWVVWLIRLMGLAIVVMFSMFSVFFVRSINHRMKQRQWLRSGAGLEVEIDRASDALEDIGPILDSLAQAESHAEKLEGQLAASNEAIQQLYALLNHVDPGELVAAVERAGAAEQGAGAEEDHPDGA